MGGEHNREGLNEDVETLKVEAKIVVPLKNFSRAWGWCVSPDLGFAEVEQDRECTTCQQRGMISRRASTDSSMQNNVRTLDGAVAHPNLMQSTEGIS